MGDDERQNPDEEIELNPYSVCGVDIYMSYETATRAKIPFDFTKQFRMPAEESPFYFVGRHYQVTSFKHKTTTTITNLTQVPLHLRNNEAAGMTTIDDHILDISEGGIVKVLTPLDGPEMRYILRKLIPEPN